MSIAAGAWLLCPHCRVFIDRSAVELVGDSIVVCPWCSISSLVSGWAEGAARDVCDCGCPRAAHTAYRTDTGEPPAKAGHVVVTSAPCIGCGCTRVSGAAEVRA